MNNRPKILVLDDNEAIRHLLRKILTQAGFDVQTHVELKGVLTEEFEDHFDLIITNYVMDGMKGMVFVKNLRERGKEVPVVMITGTFYPGVFISAKRVGINHIMAKPLSEETVVQVVHRLLRQSRATRVAEGSLT